MKRLLTRVDLMLQFIVIALLTLNINSAFAIVSTPEAKNMRLVGLNNLQARSACQPIAYQQHSRGIAYRVVDGMSLADGLLGNAKVPSGLTNWRVGRMTMIVDLSNPAAPVSIRL